MMPPLRNLSEALKHAAQARPTREAFVFGCRQSSVTYETLHERADVLAGALQGLGVHRGDRVALWMQNSPEWVISFFAALRLGAVVVPLNTRFTESEASYILNQSGTSVAIVDDVYRGRETNSLLFPVPTFREFAPDSGVLYSKTTVYADREVEPFRGI